MGVGPGRVEGGVNRTALKRLFVTHDQGRGSRRPEEDALLMRGRGEFKAKLAGWGRVQRGEWYYNQAVAQVNGEDEEQNSIPVLFSQSAEQVQP